MDRAATGLATNFYFWHISGGPSNTEFMSMSADPRMIRVNNAGRIDYWVVDFPDRSLDEEEFEHPVYNLKRYQAVETGGPRLVAELKDVRCRP